MSRDIIKKQLIEIKQAVNDLEEQVILDGKMSKHYAVNLDKIKKSLLVLDGFEIQIEDLVLD